MEAGMGDGSEDRESAARGSDLKADQAEGLVGEIDIQVGCAGFRDLTLDEVGIRQLVDWRGQIMVIGREATSGDKPDADGAGRYPGGMKRATCPDGCDP